MLNRAHQWKLVGVVHFEVVGVEVGLDGCFGWRLGLRVGLTLVAGRDREREEQAESG